MVQTNYLGLAVLAFDKDAEKNVPFKVSPLSNRWAIRLKLAMSI